MVEGGLPVFANAGGKSLSEFLDNASIKHAHPSGVRSGVR
jgi:hypothetical protein